MVHLYNLITMVSPQEYIQTILMLQERKLQVCRCMGAIQHVHACNRFFTLLFNI